jgi:hypothetical protein
MASLFSEEETNLLTRHITDRTQELCMEDRFDRYLQHLLGTVNSEEETVPGE